MAIDTETKRRSVLASGLQFLTVYPLADGIVDAFDREHATALYSGILAQEPPGPSIVTAIYRSRYQDAYRARRA